MPNGLPYGDIYAVNTPQTDRAAAMLIQEHKVREAKQQQEQAALDESMRKEISKVRSADLPEITQGYNDWKRASMMLAKKGGKATVQDHLDVQRLYADQLGKMRSSAEENDYLKGLNKSIQTNPLNFQDDARQKVLEWINTPTSKRDKSADGSIFYQRDPKAFAADFDAAVGQKTPVKIADGDYVPLPGGLQRQRKEYHGYFKTAPEVATSFIGRVVGQRSINDLLREHPELSDENTLKAIDEKYNALTNDPVYKAAYKGKNLEFPAWMQQSPQGKVAMYLAKQNAINNAPQEIMGKPETDLAAHMKAQEAKDIRMEGIRNAHATERVRLSNKLAEGRIKLRQASSDKERTSILEGMVDEQYNDGADTAVTINGQRYEGKEVKVPKSVADKFAIGSDAKGWKEVSTWVMTGDKKYLVPVFKTGKHTASGNPTVDREISKPILMTEYKAMLGKELLSRKDMAGEFDDYYSEDDDAQGASPAGKPTKPSKGKRAILD